MTMKRCLLPVFCAASAFVLGVLLERHVFSTKDHATVGVLRHRSSQQSERPHHDSERFAGSAQDLASLARGVNRDEARSRMHHALERTSASHLAQLAEELMAGDLTAPEQRQALRSVLTRLAERDPSRALQTVGELRDVALANHTVHVAFHRLAEQDLSAAVALFDQLDNHRLKREAIGAIVHSREDFDNLLAWAETLNGSLNLHAKREIVHRWGDFDPAAAYDYVDSLPPSELSMDLRREAASKWARVDPHAVAARVTPQQNSPTGIETMHRIAREWAASDPEAAVEWANTLQSQRSVPQFDRRHCCGAGRDRTPASRRLCTQP